MIKLTTKGASCHGAQGILREVSEVSHTERLELPPTTQVSRWLSSDEWGSDCRCLTGEGNTGDSGSLREELQRFSIAPPIS